MTGEHSRTKLITSWPESEKEEEEGAGNSLCPSQAFP
jgi:hypothetical protein